MDFQESMCRFCASTEDVVYDIFDETNDMLNKCLMYLHIKVLFFLYKIVIKLVI